jgi:diguanylate cyclase (GGDEF)-like protein
MDQGWRALVSARAAACSGATPTIVSNSISGAADDASRLHRQLYADCVQLLYRHAPGGLIVSAFAAILMAILGRRLQDDSRYLYWLLLILSVLGLCALDLRLRQRQGARVHARAPLWMLRFSTGKLATSVGWAAFAMLFLPHMDALGRTTSAFICAALATGAVATLASVRTLAWSYCLLMLAPPSLILLGQSNTAEVVFGGFCVVYAAAMLYAIQSAHRAIWRSLSAFRENARLRSENQRRREEMERLNAELAAMRAGLNSINATLEATVRRRTQELEQLATCDPLTGLANRARLQQVAEQACREARNGGPSVAVVFVDLDRFKQINDGLGHSIGDEVLREIARRLSAVCDDASTVTRWGGDEFVVLRIGNDIAALQALAESLVERLSQPILIDGRAVSVGASVGIAMWPMHGEDLDTLIRNADIAVYRAKEDGRGRVRLFRADWGAAVIARSAMAHALRGALESGRLQLVFQPIVALQRDRISGYEALCRWDDPHYGPVSPSTFIPLAEESGLMPALGAWVLRQACDIAQRSEVIAGGGVYVNLSATQLQDEGFVAQLDRILAETGLAPACLGFDLPQQALASDGEALHATLRALRARGVRLSLDHVGDGLASLNLLRQIGVDSVKMDCAVINPLGELRDALIGAMVSLGRAVRVEVVVEGVENLADIPRLAELGVQQVQGYAIAGCLPAGDTLERAPEHWRELAERLATAG